MQQTENFKLNLIETSDTFSPAPLNENMEALEAALEAEAAARQAADAALSRRVTTLEGHRIATGTYTGDGATGSSNGQTIYLGFTPKAVLTQGTVGTTIMGVYGFNGSHIRFVTGGFQVHSNETNRSSTAYCYCALS